MRQPHYTLTSAHAHDLALAGLDTALDNVQERPCCSKQTFFAILLTAATFGWSLSATLKRRVFGCSHETARQVLLASLPDYLQLTARLLAALHDTLPAARLLRRRTFNVAIDLHKRPWYGEVDTPGVIGGKEEDGTRYFWTYATAVLLHHGQRFTVALSTVHSGRLEELLPILFGQLDKAGVRVRKLLMDKQFHSGPVVEWLKARKVPFVVPLQVRGKRLKRLAKEAKTGDHFRYRFQPRKTNYRLELNVCVLRRKRKDRKGKKKVVVMLLASWRMQKLSAGWLREIYRQRFGIETSYRQLGQGLAASSSSNQEWRLLLVGLALLLRNLWVMIHWEYLSEARPGGRLIHLDRLPLGQLLDWLSAEATSCYPARNEVQTSRPIVLGNVA